MTGSNWMITGSMAEPDVRIADTQQRAFARSDYGGVRKEVDPGSPINCEYCGQPNAESNFACEYCGAVEWKPEPDKHEWRADGRPFFYEGYVVYWLVRPGTMEYQVCFYRGMELVHCIETDWTSLRNICPEHENPMPYIMNMVGMAENGQEHDLIDVEGRTAKFRISRVWN